MTAIHTSLASPAVQSDEHSLCCHQCAGTGVRLCLAGGNLLLDAGLNISSESSLKVSINKLVTTLKLQLILVIAAGH